MAGQKLMFKWINSVISFVLLVVLSLTGFIHWLVLPRGFERSRGTFVSLRHFLREIHEIAAVLFLVAMFIHLMLNWPYIKANLKRHGMIR